MRDSEHLRLLSVFYYVHAGLMALATLWPLIYVVMGLFVTNVASSPSSPSASAVVVSSSSSSGVPVPAASPSSPHGVAMSVSEVEEAKMIGTIFIIVGVVMSLCFLALATANFFAARALSKRRNRMFIFVVGCINLLAMPLGTTLGVFTLIVMLRPTIQGLFEGQNRNLESVAAR